MESPQPLDEEERESRATAEVLREMEAWLGERGWVASICAVCGRTFHAKARRTAGHCGRQTCCGPEFLSLPGKKAIPEASEAVRTLADFFEGRGYRHAGAVPLVSPLGNNLFVGTAGQLFDPVIHGDAPIDPRPLFVAQPVVRLQSRGLVGQQDGFSTSFVNVATEHLGATPEQHLGHLDDWLTALSAQGLYVGDMTVSLKQDSPDWGHGPFHDAVLSLYYRGLELAYANYFHDIPQRGRPPVTLSDVSFGLERLLWAVSKSPSYFQGIGPMELSLLPDRHARMDAIRTGVLMLASGVEFGHRDCGSKLRALLGTAIEPGGECPEALARYYHRWWSRFAAPLHTEERVLCALRAEWNRAVNLCLARVLCAPGDVPIDLATDEYLRVLVRRGITFRRIQEVLCSPSPPADEAP